MLQASWRSAFSPFIRKPDASSPLNACSRPEESLRRLNADTRWCDASHLRQWTGGRATRPSARPPPAMTTVTG
jgi:hypothetical protein